MGYTLDQLLDATGVNELSGGHLVKKAAAPQSQDLSKLAERCRRALEASPEDSIASNEQDLVEKTAAVAVIGRTLAEISDISRASPETIKTAAQSTIPGHAPFIKTALDTGHSPHDIAEFLEKNALVGKLWRRYRVGAATRRFQQAGRAGEQATAQASRSLREWQDIIRKSDGVSKAEKAALISRMRRNLGDQSTLNAFSSMKAPGFKNLDSFKDLQKAVPAKAAAGGATGAQLGKKPLAASISVSGKQIGLTSEQLSKAKKPALYAGAGYMGHRALTGGGSKSDNGSKRGPVIITG